MEEMEYEELECPVCRNEYCSMTGDPRTLSCGHSLCTECLKNIIGTGKRECAECRQAFDFSSFQNVPVSITLKKLILDIQLKRKKQIFLNKFQEISSVSDKHEAYNLTDNSPLIAFGECQVHSAPLHFGCTVCDMWLCGTCALLSHSNKDSSCKVLPVLQSLQEKKNNLICQFSKLKDSLNIDIADQQAYIKLTKNFIEKIKGQIDRCQQQIMNLESEKVVQKMEAKTLQERLALIVDLEMKLREATLPEDVKNHVDFYFLNKDYINKKEEKPNMVLVWKRLIQEIVLPLDDLKTAFIKHGLSGHDAFWIKLNMIKQEVIISPSNAPPQNKIVFEPLFPMLIDYTRQAFIDIALNQNGRLQNSRINFLIDPNPLGEEFLKRCCSQNNGFIGTSASIYVNYGLIILGGSSPNQSNRESEDEFDGLNPGHQRSIQANRQIQDNFFAINDTQRYRRPLAIKTVGIMSNTENNVDINRMQIYICLNNVGHHRPRNYDTIYSCFAFQNQGTPQLKLCIGKIIEEIPLLQGAEVRSTGLIMK